MTIPSRAAPPPPILRNQQTNQHQVATNQQWNNCWNDSTSSPINTNKKPPPRPPPPKLTTEQRRELPFLKKPDQQSKNILSNIFGKRTNSAKTNKREALSAQTLSSSTSLSTSSSSSANTTASIRKQAITPIFNNSTTITAATTTNTINNNKSSDLQLISFDSPPSSPTLTQKSSSDCVSVDSFSSDSNSSPLTNYSASQAESGFEDDFITESMNFGEPSKTKFSSNGLADPFSLAALTQSAAAAKPKIQAKPIVIGKTSFYAPATNSAKSVANKQPDFLDPLSNGRSIISAPPVITMPTIIKPNVKPPILKEKPILKNTIFELPISNVNSTEEEQCFSLPMPSCPPPPPPPEILLEEADTTVAGSTIDSNDGESYGIALYAFSGEQDDDLDFKENEKIYLIEQLSDEWMLGKTKRGCVGMFPINYIDIKIPLKRSDIVQEKNKFSQDDCATSVASSVSIGVQARVLYDFNGEVAEDLTIKCNEIVTVLHNLDSEWLYGELNGRKGQFPTNYVEYI